MIANKYSNADDELIKILKTTSSSVEARSVGWNLILRLSSTSDGLRHIISSKKYLHLISSYIDEDEAEEELIKLAYKSLINISSEDMGLKALLKCQGRMLCSDLIESISEENSKFMKFKCYVLSNLTTHPEFREQLLHNFVFVEQSYRHFVAHFCDSEEKLRSQYDFLSLTFANVSQGVDGRRMLMKDRAFMKIIQSTKPSEPDCRRLGAGLILRNICLETEYHEKLLNDMDILPALLLPLMIPQQYEGGGEMGHLPPELQQRCLAEVKERDKNVSVRRVLVEALTILCYSEVGWRILKSNGTYYVVRDLHAWETDPLCKEAIEQLVSYFLVANYTKPEPTLGASCSKPCSNILVEQLESDMTQMLPDFVV